MCGLDPRTEPDWDREAPKTIFHKGPRLVCAIRNYQRWSKRTGIAALLVSKWFRLTHQFWSVLGGADIPLCCEIGGGFRLPHPNGVVIHPYAKIGINCTVLQQVTIGSTLEGNDVATIGNGVYIGSGARILGAVHIGDFAKIGANAVVNSDVPTGATAVGIPARMIKHGIDLAFSFAQAHQGS